jgi:hypothetical protein
LDQSPNAEASATLNSKYAALQKGQADAAAQVSSFKNIFGEQAQDCAPAILRAQPNYAELKAQNYYVCDFSEESQEMCAKTSAGTSCISIWDGPRAGTVDIKPECNALPVDIIQSQFVMDQMTGTFSLKWKSSFTGPDFDKRNMVGSQRASRFREIIEQICARCEKEAPTKDAGVAFKSKCDTVLSVTPAVTPKKTWKPSPWISSVAVLEPSTWQITTSGVVVLVSFMLAVIVLIQRVINRKGAEGLGERLMHA